MLPGPARLNDDMGLRDIFEKSPCIGVCTMDANLPDPVGGPSGLCKGCFRNMNEIAGWGGMKKEEKIAVKQECLSRKERLS